MKKTRGLLEFQVLPIPPRHYAARMAVNQRPTAPEDVAYQLAKCVAIRRQQLCQILSSMTPPSRCDPSL